MRARVVIPAIAAAALLAAPAVAMSATEDITFAAAGAERHAVVSATARTPNPPVVLVLPREGTTAEDAIARFGYSISATGATAVALDPLPCTTLGGKTCWAPMEAAGNRRAVDASAVIALLDILDKRTDMDTGRLVVLGENSGAAFGVTMTLSQPSRIDGVLGIAAFDPTRTVVLDPASAQVVFPLALGGNSTIRRQRNRQHVTLMRGSADVVIPPALTAQLRTRLSRAGWTGDTVQMVTVGGAANASPALAAPRRVTPRLRELLFTALDLDTAAGQVKRLAKTGYLPANATSSNTSSYALEQALMAFQGWNGLARDGVAGPATQRRLATAGRPVPRRSGSGKRLEGYIDKQVVLLVRNGRTERVIHFSSGAAGNTPRGTFSIYRKESMSWSVPFSSWMPYASYFTGGYAFHEYPYVPGYPASHGCVRIASPFAPYLYEFAGYGTPVYMY